MIVPAARATMQIIRVSEGHYLLTGGNGVVFDADRLRRDRSGDLVGELSVSCAIAGAATVDGVLSIGSFNFSSTRARQERAALLSRASRTGNAIDWPALLEHVCQKVLAAERQGQPAIVLADLAAAPQEPEHNVLGLSLPRKDAGCFFADGDTGKSLIALYVAGVLEQQGEHVLFCDYETDEQTQRERLAWMFPDADLPRLRYIRCGRPLVYEVDRLRRIVADDKITYLMVDSVGYATDGPPENAEGALGYFRALRQLGVGSLSLAHISRGEQGDRKPFGSVFWSNSFRSVWFLKRAESAEPMTITVGAFHRKHNNGRLYPAVGLQLTIEAGRIGVQTVSVAAVDDLAPGLPLWQRMREAVTSGPLTLARLAEDLGAKVETLDRTVRRRRDLFVRVDGRDGVSRIALLERRAS